VENRIGFIPSQPSQARRSRGESEGIAMIDALAREACRLETVEEFKAWTRTKIRAVFPHRALTCRHGRVYAGGVAPDYCVAVDMPIEYLQRARNRAGVTETPIMRRWLATREPQLFDADRPGPDVPEEWLRNYRKYDLKDTAAHGVHDTERCISTYYCFHRIPGPLSRSHVEALRQLVPVLHEALCRVIERLGADGKLTAALAGLNEREREIVGWLRQGKPNSEIADLVHLSESTVKHYATRIFGKLGVDSRAQLLHRLAEHEAQTALGLRTKIL